MRWSIQQCGCQLRVIEYVGPFREARVGGADQAGFLVELVQQLEQQGTTGLAEWQGAQLIEDEQSFDGPQLVTERSAIFWHQKAF
jgi:hypothetical protein